MSEAPPRDVASAARVVLLTADPYAKVMATRRLAREWRHGVLSHGFDAPMPDRPARPVLPELLPPNRMPRRRRGGTERTRIAMLHAVAHIEFSAIDLAVDIAGRFGGEFPRAFVDDWLGVAADEAMHFALVDRRLRALGSHYGAMPAHDGLWEAAEATRGCALARLAIVPMVLEARGLDVTPAMIARFEAQGDMSSARILNRILTDEVRHVAAGTKWFTHLCGERSVDPVATWKSLVKSRFRGGLKPPFNDSARAKAGLTQDYYVFIAS